MKFARIELPDLVIIDLEQARDDRGYFARTFCADAFAAEGLPTIFPQCNVSFNRIRGTLRGMHWQGDPHPEGKLVRCVRGKIFDVAIDLRPESSTYLRSVAVELSQENMRALYIPPGFAHGFQTLDDESEVFYQMTTNYRPELARGVRWNDPTFRIEWPIGNPIVSPRDAAFADSTS